MTLYLSESATASPVLSARGPSLRQSQGPGSLSETILHSDFPEPELSWTVPPTLLVSGEHQSEAEVVGLIIPTDLQTTPLGKLEGSLLI